MGSILELVDQTDAGHSQVYQLWSWNGHANDDHQHYTIRLQQRVGARGRVYIAVMGSLGENPSRTVIAKIARNDEVAALDWEAELYENDLKGLQGSVVPKCHGYFKRRSGGQSLACLVLEFCNQPLRSTDFSHQIMLAVAKLHKIGIYHGNMTASHFVLASNGIRIIDFVQAQRHRCHSSLVRSSPGGVRYCEELSIMAQKYGYSDESQIDLHAHRLHKDSSLSIYSAYHF